MIPAISVKERQLISGCCSAAQRANPKYIGLPILTVAIRTIIMIRYEV